MRGVVYGLCLWRAMRSHGRLWSKSFVCGEGIFGDGGEVAPQPSLVAEFQPAERTPVLVESSVRPKGPLAGRRVLGLVVGGGQGVGRRLPQICYPQPRSLL